MSVDIADRSELGTATSSDSILAVDASAAAGSRLRRVILDGKKSSFVSGSGGVVDTSVFYAKSFGIVNDGITDDLLSIQAALDTAAAVGGGTVVLPPGTMLVSNALLVPSNTTLLGSGRATTVIKNPAGDLPGKLSSTVYSTIAMAGVTNSKVIGIGVDHFTNGTTANGISIMPNGSTLSSNCEVIDCKVDGYDAHQYLIWVYKSSFNTVVGNHVVGHAAGGSSSSQEGIELYGGTGNQIRNNLVDGVARDGIYVWTDGSSGSVSNTLVRDNEVIGGKVGVSVILSGTNYNVGVSNNNIHGQTQYGIKFGSNDTGAVINSLVSQNKVHNVSAIGIFIDGQNSSAWRNVSVLENQVNNLNGDGNSSGIYLNAVNGIYVGNNSSNDSAGTSMFVSGGANLFIFGNFLNNSVSHGIIVDYGAANILVVNNNIRGYSTGSADFNGVRINTASYTRVLNNTFKFGTSEVYAVLATSGASDVSIGGNIVDYVPSFSSPFRSDSSTTRRNVMYPVLNSGGDKLTEEILGSVNITPTTLLATPVAGTIESDGVHLYWTDSGAARIGLDSAGGSMVYPGSGVPNSTGSAWGTSYSVDTDLSSVSDSDNTLASAKAIRTALDLLEAKIPGTLELTSDTSLSEAQILTNKYTSNYGASGTINITLPAVSYTISRTIYLGAVQIVNVKPPSGEMINLSGTNLTANNKVTSATTPGNTVVLVRLHVPTTGWQWFCKVVNGTWIDGGA